ncbi:PREDICTED: heavy metal-associated isoprenylated plant protein 20 [Tarenaya hassleriana]|uniref:heavy metal-associated isoprenylated plant protein 20 n=1 Tax=Tarenaya hassleriana TaxID=28532 RepID=UPI00053C14C9|nr:PREDICTED: heavy metal-associated isoprenylated plant protein 20 [Tarenaya hassleriana]
MTNIVELDVHIDCEGCENRVRRTLQKLKGVQDVQIDMKLQKVTVTGWAEEKKVLKAARKTGRRATLWQYPYNPESNGYHDRYYKKRFSRHNNMARDGERVSSYNYYKHGYDGHDHGYYVDPPCNSVIDEATGSVFSEENPHFCTIV